jgi:hypothetical protein
MMAGLIKELDIVIGSAKLQPRDQGRWRAPNDFLFVP